MKKFIVLGVLFVLPITVYIFFASSTNYFKLLPVVSQEVSELDRFYDLDEKPVKLQGRISILGFFGNIVHMLITLHIKFTRKIMNSMNFSLLFFYPKVLKSKLEV